MSGESNNILSFLQNKTNTFKDDIALGMRSEYGWSEFTYQGLSMLSRRIASYLINEKNVKKEEKIAILSESKVEFGAVYFASIIAGTTLIPLDIKLTEHELNSILSNCAPSIIFASAKYYETAKKLKNEINSINEIILIDETSNNEIKSIYNIEKNYDAKFRQRSLNSTALIIYTSGTTGNPKGVQITFRNILAQVSDLKKGMEQVFKKDEKVNVLSILPMNHLFELTFGFAAFLNLGYSIYYTKSLKPKDTLSVMRDKKIRFMCTVPSFFKMLKMQFESDLAKESKFKRFMFNFNFHYVAKFLPFECVKKYLFKDIHSKLGNNFYGFVSGGAPMDLDMGKYFKRIGINVFQGYGLSEASPVVTFSMKKNLDMRSVGLLLNSFQAKIDKDTNELLVKGPAVMKGYYKQDELTKETITTDGWLHTGDVARIDKKGQVFITGRIKNMIVLPGGKKVFPEEVEAAMNESEFIKESCALSTTKNTGEKKGTEEVTIVVSPKDEMYENYDDKTVEAMVINEVKKKSLKLSQFKRPTNIIVIKGELPKTATRKIVKKEVKKLIETR